MGEHQPQDRQQMQRVLQRPRRFVPELGVLMGNKRPDADHMRLELLHKPDVLNDISRGLIGGADHDPAAHLIADVLEIPQAALAVFNAQLRGMEHAVVCGIGRLLPQKIPLRSGIKIRLIALPAFLPDGQGNGAVRMVSMDLRYQLAHPLIGIPRILAPLQHKGAEAQLAALPAAVQNLLLAQPIAPGVLITPADAAVIAVVLADVGELDEPPEIDLMTVDPVPHLPCRLIEILRRLCVQSRKQCSQICIR